MTTTTKGKCKVKFSMEERVAIVAVLKRCAVDLAELWDVLRDIESEHETDIEVSDALVGVIATDLGHPPSTDQLQDSEVWDAFLEHIS